MKHKDSLKFVFMIILLIILIAFESALLPTLVSSSFINKNTAGYMIFGVELPSNWNEKSQYNWLDSDIEFKNNSVKELENEFSDIVVEVYGKNYYTYSLANILVSNSGSNIDFEVVWDLLDESEFGKYLDEFVRMQAGFLVGDNLLPIPSTSDLQTKLNEAVISIKDDDIVNWYTKNETNIIASLKVVMLKSNDTFSIEILQSNPIFSESCLILKIFNVLLLFYFELALIAIIIFFLFLILKNKFTYILASISQVVTALISIATYFSLNHINFVVLGVPYQPSKVMINDCLHILIIFVTVTILSCVLLATVHFFKSKNKFKKDVIKK